MDKSNCYLMSVQQQPIIEQTSTRSSYSSDGFHTHSVHTLLKTCRPTCAPPVKVWLCPLRLSHTINVWHRKLSIIYYTSLPMHYTPVMGRQWETATGGVCAILLHSAGDCSPNERMCWYNKVNTNSIFTNEVRI